MSNIVIEKNKLIIKGFYSDEGNLRPSYNFGIYGKIGDGWVDNPYASPGAHCSSRMIWAYNNPYQPHTDLNYRQGIRMGYIDGSRANGVKVLGSMKEIWKEFEQVAKRHGVDLASKSINFVEEVWWNYYILSYSDKFEAGVQKFENYIKAKRALFTEEERAYEKEIAPEFSDDETWIAGCRDYLQYLVRKSARGFIMEVILFSALQDLCGGEIIESTAEDERKGIDGYLLLNGVKHPVCLKPTSFRGGVSPIYEGCMVYYSPRLKGSDDLVYTFKTGAEIFEKYNEMPVKNEEKPLYYI